MREKIKSIFPMQNTGGKNFVDLLALKCAAYVCALVLLVAAMPAFAVDVKYHGEVDIKSGDFKSFKLKHSSFVHEIHYDRSERYLIVRLRSQYYHYCRIPRRAVRKWVRARSLGRHYNSHIKGNYDCREGGVPNY